MYQVHKQGKEFYLALPYMLRDGQLADEEPEFLKMAEQCEGFLVRNLEEAGIFIQAWTVAEGCY